MQPFSHFRSRIFFVILFLILIVTTLSVSASPLDTDFQQNIDTNVLFQTEPTFPPPTPGDVPQEVELERAREAIENVLEKQVESLGVGISWPEPVDIVIEDSWAYGKAEWIIDEIDSAIVVYVLAHRQEDGIWQALFPDQENLYHLWLESFPESLISLGLKENINSFLLNDFTDTRKQTLGETPISIPHLGEYDTHANINNSVAFTDEVYGYEFDVPVSWNIRPADRDKIGSVIQLTNNDSMMEDQASNIKIELGVFTYNKPDDVELSVWAQPDTNAAEYLMHQEVVTVAGRSALRQDYVDNQGSGSVFLIPTERGLVYFVAVMPLEALNIQTVEGIVGSMSITPLLLGEREERSRLYSAGASEIDETSNQAAAIASPAGYRLPFVGFHTITNGPGCYSTHQGKSYEAIDFGQIPVGTSIYTTQSGNVIYAVYGWNDGFGNLLKIQHSDGNTSWYAHLDSFVKTGGSVNWEELVAYSGNTGNSTAPHLHFEVRNSSDYSIWIRDMPGITWYSGNPNNPCQLPGSNDGEAVGPSLGSGGTCSAPQLVSPADSQTMNSSTVTLDWNAPSCSGLTGYTLHVTTGTGPEDGIIPGGDTGVTPSEYPFTFPNDGTFYWHVAAWANGQRGPWSSRRVVINTSGTSTGNWHADYYDGHDRWWDTNNTGSFRCSGNLSDTLILDENWGTGAPCGMDGDEWVADYTGTINFSPGTYVFYLDHDDGAKLWINGQEVASMSSSGTNSKVCNGSTGYNLSGNTTLRTLLREDGGDARIRLWWDTNVNACLPPSPAIPTLQSPADGTLLTEGNSVTLMWNNAANATEYYAEFWGGPAGVINSGWQSGLNWQIGSQWAGYTYSWHVKSRNGAGESGWSNTWSFTVRPGSPTNLSGNATSCTNIELNWQDNSGNEEGYNVYRNNVFVGQVSSNTVSYLDSNLTNATTYSYYIKAYRGSIESAASNTASITTLTCPSDPDLHPITLSGYPYPVVPSSIANSHVVSSLFANQTTYFDWHFTNSGNGTALGTFYVELWVDDTRFIRYPYTDYPSGLIRGFDDWAENVSDAGWHTVKLVTDPDNNIVESSESNNEWSMDFYWTADLHEPNNSINEATDISYGNTLSGEIGPVADEDFYQFSGLADDKIVIEIDAQSMGSALDSVIELIDSDGNSVLAFNDDEFASYYDSKLGYTLPHDGTYYIRLRDYGYNGHPDFFYNIRLYTDFNAPNASIVSPLDYTLLDSNMVTIIAEGNDGESGIRYVDFFWHDDKWGETDWVLLGSNFVGWVNGVWTWQFDTSSLPSQDGAAFFIYAYDWAYNYVGHGVYNLSLQGNPGIDTTGLFDSTEGRFYLSDTHIDGQSNWDYKYFKGTSPTNRIPIVGDWDGDGIDTVGLFDQTLGRFFLTNSHAGAVNSWDYAFNKGSAATNRIPIAGDWDGDGIDTIGLYDPDAGRFYLTNSLTSGKGSWDHKFFRGPSSSTRLPIVGDWDGDGIDTVGLFAPDEGRFYLSDSHISGRGDWDYKFYKGLAPTNRLPIAGDWNEDEVDTVGLYDSTEGKFYLTNIHGGTKGSWDMAYFRGPTNSNRTPITGDWDGQ